MLSMCIPRLFMRGSKKLAAAELWKNGLVGVWLFTATLGTSVFFHARHWLVWHF